MGVWYVYFILVILSAGGASIATDHQQWGLALFFSLLSVLMTMMAVAEKICKAIRERSQ